MYRYSNVSKTCMYRHKNVSKTCMYRHKNVSKTCMYVSTQKCIEKMYVSTKKCIEKCMYRHKNGGITLTCVFFFYLCSLKICSFWFWIRMTRIAFFSQENNLPFKPNRPGASVISIFGLMNYVIYVPFIHCYYSLTYIAIFSKYACICTSLPSCWAYWMWKCIKLNTHHYYPDIICNTSGKMIPPGLTVLILKTRTLQNCYLHITKFCMLCIWIRPN
jgi:hypothetical protein